MDTIVQTIAVHEHALDALNRIRDRLLKKKATAVPDTAAIDELLVANQRAIDALRNALSAAAVLRGIEEKRLWSG